MGDMHEYWILPEGAVKQKSNALAVFQTNDMWARQYTRDYVDKTADDKVQLWRISRNRNGAILRAVRITF